MLTGRVGARLRGEDDGFSLMELLAAMMIGSIVLTALMTVFTTGMQNTNRAANRVEGTQAARAAVDRATTLLDAQACLQTVVGGQEQFVSPILEGSDANKVTFYADLKGASATPDKYTLEYNGAAHTLTEQVVAGSGAMPNVTFSGPARTRVTPNIWQAVDASNVAQPVFRYYAFKADGTLNPTPLAVPLTVATAPTVAKVVVQLAAAGDHSNTPDLRATSVMGEAAPLTTDPTTDPTDPTSAPTVCPKS